MLEGKFPELIQLDPDGAKAELFVNDKGIVLPSAKPAVEAAVDAIGALPFIRSAAVDIRDLVLAQTTDEITAREMVNLNDTLLRAPLVPLLYYWTGVQQQAEELGEYFAMNINMATTNHPEIANSPTENLRKSARHVFESGPHADEAGTLLEGLYKYLVITAREQNKAMPDDRFDLYSEMSIRVPIALAVHIGDLAYQQAVRTYSIVHGIEQVELDEADIERLTLFGIGEGRVHESFNDDDRKGTPEVDDGSMKIREDLGLDPIGDDEETDAKPDTAVDLDEGSVTIHGELGIPPVVDTTKLKKIGEEDDDDRGDGEGPVPIPA